jgi:EmrB/QacA subfamily drug resistance transporter
LARFIVKDFPSPVPAENIDILFTRDGPAYRWLVTFTCVTGAVTGGLASTTVNVAFPDLMGTFGLGRDQAQLLSTGYFAAQTVGLLISAWLIKAFGERTSNILALVLFLFGSAMSGFAENSATLMVGRVVQGLSAGVLQPLAMAVVFSVFPAGRKGLSMGIFSMGMVVAPTLGPTLGGLAIEFFNWRYIFLLTLPTTFLALVLSAFFLPSREIPEHLPKFDFLGFSLLCVALVGLLLGFSFGQRLGWTSNDIVMLFSVGTACGVAFVFKQLYGDEPLVNLYLYRNLQFTTATLVAFFTECAFISSTIMLPLFVQQIQQFTPLDAGLMLVPSGLVMLVLFPVSGRIADMVPPQYMVYAGLIFYSLSFAFMAGMDVNTPFWTLVGFTMVMRMGSAFTRPVTNAKALSSLRDDQVHQGSSALNFTRKLGGAIGANSVIVFLELRISFHGDAFATMQTTVNQTGGELLDRVVRLFTEAGVPEIAREPGALRFLGDVILAQASTRGFQDAFTILAIMAFAAIVPAIMMARAMKTTPVAAKTVRTTA